MTTRTSKIFLAVLALAAVSTACGLFGPTNTAPGFNPAYADTDGDGFVPAAGDPLYDEHYAKDVNNPNAQALDTLAEQEKKLAEAEWIQEQANKAAQEAAWLGLLRTIFLGILGIVALVIVIGILSGGGQS